jgi:hypothetical protein
LLLRRALRFHPGFWQKRTSVRARRVKKVGILPFQLEAEITISAHLNNCFSACSCREPTCGAVTSRELQMQPCAELRMVRSSLLLLRFQGKRRQMLDDLLLLLDGLEDDPDLEPTCWVEDGYRSMADECEPPDDGEPSLGSFDGVVNQEHAV